MPHPGRFNPGKDPVPIVQEAGWAPEPVWTCVENLAPTGIQSLDRPVRSESLYRLNSAIQTLENILLATPQTTMTVAMKEHTLTLFHPR